MSTIDTPSPTSVRDHEDPGDETQRNFRYQHAYGVILLLAAVKGSKEYVHLWCEHHEDFLAERPDRTFDAYQIKTAKPENGHWVWKHRALRDSIKRFVALHKKFPTSISTFFFVSNVEPLDSDAEDQLLRSPLRLLKRVKETSTLDGKLKEAFEDLRVHCQCDASELHYVLKRSCFIKGPDRDGFDAVIAHDHLPSLPECKSLTAAQCNLIRDELVQIVYHASSLRVEDPDRHLISIKNNDKSDPYLQNKKVTVASVRSLIRDSTTRQLESEKLQEIGDSISETVVAAATRIDEMWRAIIKQLDLVSSYDELPKDHIRRLPTALVVANYGVIPYDDSLGLKAELKAWAKSGDTDAPTGRLYAAAGGYGKTRLALESVVELSKEGWRTGFLPRTTLEQKNIHGEQDTDEQLDRFFKVRKDKGVLIVLDYAESRIGQIERVTKAALRNSKNGGPIRIVLLSRNAGEWWEELHRESRDIQLVFERDPIEAVAQGIPPENHEAFFQRAAAAFAEKLAEAQAPDDVLLSPDWSSTKVKAKRRVGSQASSPLSIAFESFLYVRGIVVEHSPLAEMAREERRHWARALKLGIGDTNRIGDPRIDAMHRCAVILTLLQGSQPAQEYDIDKVLNEIIHVALKDASPLAATEIQRAAVLAVVKSSIEKLYRHRVRNGDILRPVLPDMLGEHVCSDIGPVLANLARRTVDAFPLKMQDVLLVLDRATKPLHGAQNYTWTTAALSAALKFDTEVQVKQAVRAAYTAEGSLVAVLESKMTSCDFDELDRLHNALPNRSGSLARLASIVADLRQNKPFGINIYDGKEGRIIQTTSSELAEVARRHRDAALRLVGADRFEDALKAAEEAVINSRWLRRFEEIPGSRDLARSLRALGLAYGASGDIPKAIITLLEALGIASSAYARDGDDDMLFEISSIEHNLGKAAGDSGDFHSAASYAMQAVAKRMKIFEKDPDCAHDLVNSLMNASAFVEETGDVEKACQYALDGIEIMKKLYLGDSAVYAESYASALLMVGRRLITVGRIGEAVERLASSTEVYRTLFDKEPRRYARGLAGSSQFGAEALMSLGEVTAALDTLRSAIRCMIPMRLDMNHVGILLGAAKSILDKRAVSESFDQFLQSVGLDRTKVRFE